MTQFKALPSTIITGQSTQSAQSKAFTDPAIFDSFQKYFLVHELLWFDYPRFNCHLIFGYFNQLIEFETREVTNLVYFGIILGHLTKRDPIFHSMQVLHFKLSIHSSDLNYLRYFTFI